ncbi:uncharacterized protein LOC143915311 [Arctopsyche grandis]|uniref:uncharacterized protein LOC143915311 n=1 Tax=Arctopsyche grandis TaxID=121162 RepID=UPI00406D9C57
MKNQKSQAMTLTLCLEDNAGKDTNLEVKPNDDFGSFLQRAKKILGYAPQLTDITEGKVVSLKDNIYRFLIEAEMNKGIEKEAEKSAEEEEEEFGEIEYLAEDEEELFDVKEEKPPLIVNESTVGYESEEYAPTEYLEEDSDEPGIVDLEILDSSLEEDIDDLENLEMLPPKKKARLADDDLGVDDIFNTLTVPVAEDTEQIYTTKELLDVLGDSSDETPTKSNLKNGHLGSKTKIKTKIGSKYAYERQAMHKHNLKTKSKTKVKANDKKSKYSTKYSSFSNDLKDVSKSSFFAKRQMEKSLGIKKLKQDEVVPNKKADVKKKNSRLSSFDLAMLKRTVRQPIIALPKMTDLDIRACQESVDEIGNYISKSAQKSESFNSVSLDDSRFLPANYEDIDNEGVYDYMEDVFNQTDMNDLLTVRKDKSFVPAKPSKKAVKDEISKAVGGIHKAMGLDKKFSNLVRPAKKPRGRPPKKFLKLMNDEPIKKEADYDSHMTFLESVVKREPIDDEDDDYMPSKDNLDWMKNKKKGKYSCRMCSTSFTRLMQAVNHALCHQIPGKAIFPCILCAYAFTTYSELQKHMKNDHRKSKSPSMLPDGTPKPKGKPGRPKKGGVLTPTLIKPEIMDDEEVCDVEMLEEWLDEDDTLVDFENVTETEEFVELLKAESIELKDEVDEHIEAKEDAEDDDTKQVNKVEEIDFTVSGDEEWLLDEGEEEAARVSEDSDTVKESKSIQKRRGRKPKFRKFKCSTCLRCYDSHNTLRSHVCSGPKEKLRGTRGAYRCALCGQTFTTRRRLVYHRSFHQVELLERKMVCKDCPGRKFTSEAELFDHINNEHNVDFVCEEPGCTKQFHLRSALRAHSRTHGTKSYQCQECGKQFYDIHNLKEHNITHLTVKPFQCHICLKFLNRRSRLRMHLLAHVSCPVENCVLVCKCCKMAFKDAADAEVHILNAEDCRNYVLANENEELLSAFESSDDKKFIEIDIDDPPKISIRLETTVDDIVNETLADNEIVSMTTETTTLIQVKDENDENASEMLGGDDSMKALLAEVGAVKLMLTEDGTVGEILEDHSVAPDDNAPINEESRNRQSVKDLLEGVGTIKDLLENVDPMADQNVVNDSETSAMITELQNELLDSSNVIKDETGVKNMTLVRNSQIFTEDELMSQLSENSKLFIKVVKIKVVYRCEYCEKNYYTKDALNAHRLSHDGLRNPFICNVCKAAFSTFARCTSHKTTHGFYKLNIEEDKEKNPNDVTNHENFPVIKYFLCQHCSKTFLHWTYLQVHRRHKHSQNTYYFNCKICGDRFTDSWLLNSHRRKVHAESINCKKGANTSYKCADCGEGYNKRIELAKHRLEVHSDPSLIEQKNKPGPFACTSCDRMYQTKVGLDGHMRSHNGDIYVCDLCGNSFNHRTGLETHHKRVHLREQRYSCRTCDQNFFTSVDLENHKRCHSGEKPFPCEFCQMSFRTKGRRNEHHRTHTGERPYPCDICGVAFRRSNAMKNHRLIHTGEQRHNCPHCPKLFHVYTNLKSHIKAKHPEKCIILEIDGEPIDTLEESLKIITDADSAEVITGDLATNDAGNMLVLEDVIIEDESEAILRQDESANILEYTYETDINAHVQGSEMQCDTVEYVDGTIVDGKNSKVHIQLLDGSEHEQGLLYTVEDASMHLIEGEVRYALVDDINDDHKQQFTIIDEDHKQQFTIIDDNNKQQFTIIDDDHKQQFTIIDEDQEGDPKGDSVYYT